MGEHMLTENNKKTISDCLSNISQTLPGFQPRSGQRKMIAEVAKADSIMKAEEAMKAAEAAKADSVAQVAKADSLKKVEEEAAKGGKKGKK